jgi:DNA-binding NarL/FixJ family response regulator
MQSSTSTIKQESQEEVTKPRIAIAEDHELFRKIYEVTLEAAGMEICCMATSGDHALKILKDLKPDLFIMDIAMPGMDGLAALSVLKFMHPELPVLVISNMSDPAYRSRALELGADGFLSKAVSPTELISVIRSILAGEKIPSDSNDVAEPTPPSVPGFAFPKEQPGNPIEEDFTDQERLILSLIAMGNDNQTIIEKLHISKNTLKTHSRNIFSKLGVKDRTQAAIWAVKNGYGADNPVKG